MEILIPADRIQARVAELARQIAADYGDRPVTIVGVLTGCLIFLADLVRHLELPLRIGLIQASSYRGAATTPGQLHVQPELLPDVRGRHILLIDDILDTGQTLDYLTRHLRSLDVASVRVAVLLRKRGRQKVPFKPDYCGFEIPDAFVIGYGLDYNDEYRHLPHIALFPGETGATTTGTTNELTLVIIGFVGKIDGQRQFVLAGGAIDDSLGPDATRDGDGLPPPAAGLGPGPPPRPACLTVRPRSRRTRRLRAPKPCGVIVAS